MRAFILLTVILPIFILIASCTVTSRKPDVKKEPQYVGVDPVIKPYVDEFRELGARKHLAFSDKVTIGITTLKRGSVIGLCTYGNGWREIDLDVMFLAGATENRRKILIFHELIHCYCDRGHDFKGKSYPTDLELILQKLFISVAQEIPWCLDPNQPGYLPDGCPATIMHPYILDNQCIENHYGYYLDEMFYGCDPY